MGVHDTEPDDGQGSLYELWEAEFKPKLGDTARWEAFSFIAKDQLEREKVGILETGCLREPGNWAGDGQSTLVWDWIVSRKRGRGASLDIDHSACAIARTHVKAMGVLAADSIGFLSGFGAWPVSLLYLDAYDYLPGDEVNAAMHQVAEVAAVWKNLPSGCLIASDDNFDALTGKGTLVHRLLGSFGIKPIVLSYVLVWRKP